MIKISQLIVLTLILYVNYCASAGPVADAAERNDIDALRQLLRSGEDVNDTHGDGMTALHWAAEHDNPVIVEMLVYAGANVDGRTRIGGYTPLHIASRHGHARVVRKLIEGKADAEARTTVSGATALHLAAASPSDETVRRLLEAGAAVNTREYAWGQTPLIFAASAGRARIVDILLDAGADIAVTADVVDTAEMERPIRQRIRGSLLCCPTSRKRRVVDWIGSRGRTKFRVLSISLGKSSENGRTFPILPVNSALKTMRPGLAVALCPIVANKGRVTIPRNRTWKSRRYGAYPMENGSDTGAD